MRATYTLLARKGFWGRSLDELSRVTKSAIKQEGVTRPTAPYTLLDFRDAASVADVKKMSDKDIGGFSTVNFEHIPASSTEPAHARWHGNISIDLPQHRPDVQRTGYAAWRNHDRPPTIFGRLLWNIDPYEYMALRVKSDGRKYFVNVQTETIIPTDIHQHRLYAKRPGEWETIVIPWHEFVRTNHGMVVEPQTEMLRERVRSIGIGSIDRQTGPYEVSIQRIWATNDPEGKIEDADKEGGENKELS